eukprot:10963946-Karenia_brevis.AAC.1
MFQHDEPLSEAEQAEQKRLRAEEATGHRAQGLTPHFSKLPVLPVSGPVALHQHVDEFNMEPVALPDAAPVDPGHHSHYP